MTFLDLNRYSGAVESQGLIGSAKSGMWQRPFAPRRVQSLDGELATCLRMTVCGLGKTGGSR
ncbi:MAG: hypothetical protein IH989_00240 [Planctomycetes bacterium]|nr:hypothetical protein [Planctomycetota bacterium]